jgi:hypothetical protein
MFFSAPLRISHYWYGRLHRMALRERPNLDAVSTRRKFVETVETSTVTKTAKADGADCDLTRLQQTT